MNAKIQRSHYQKQMIYVEETADCFLTASTETCCEAQGSSLLRWLVEEVPMKI